MNNNKEGRLLLVVCFVHRAVKHRIIGGADAGREVGRSETQILLHQVTDHSLIDIVGLVHRPGEAEGVVLSHILSISPCDSVMMLVDTQGIHHALLGLKDLSYLMIGDLLIDDPLGKELAGSMEVCRAVLHLFLHGRSRSEEAGPEVVLLIRVREHIVILWVISKVLLLEGIDECLRGACHQLHVHFVMRVDISDQFLHLMEVLTSIIPCKITTPGQGNVVAAVSRHELLMDVVDELAHPLFGVE
mmetsp:Transcript_14834/g.23004  ORF Transcript_14834/g.23004 Transcript_14834/m.23004 type:complete len:245 (-) Transcript_14834:1056-1790(-)